MNENMTLVKQDVKLPWLRLALSFIFIFNPNISVIDPLPDFIGYILIVLSLSKFSMLCATLAEAKKAFEKMIIVDGAKLLALIWIFGLDTTASRSSSMLMASFSISALEVMFGLPAFLKLFAGISELGNYHPNTTIHATPRTTARSSYTESLRSFTLFFVVFKAAMTLLPELAELGNSSYSQVEPLFDIYRYIGIMRFLSAVPVLFVGVIWLVRVIKYFRRLAADSELNDSMCEKYRREISPKEGTFVIRYVKIGSWLLTAAAVLTLDFTLEGVNIMSDAAVAVFLALAMLFFSKAVSMNTRPTYISAVCYAILSIGTDVLSILFDELYSYGMLDTNSRAMALYICMLAVQLIKSVSFVVMLSLAITQIKKLVRTHTGYVLGFEAKNDKEQKQIDGMQEELSRSFTHILDVSVIYVIADIALSLYGIFYAFMRRNVGFLGVVDFAAGILFIAMTVRALGDLRFSVQTKYMLE